MAWGSVRVSGVSGTFHLEKWDYLSIGTIFNSFFDTYTYMSYNTNMKFFSYSPNYDEGFCHLSKAPIVEAVIDLQVVSVASWNDKILKDQIIKSLPSYPKVDETREIKVNFSFDGSQPQQAPENVGCIGFRATSQDNFYIAQFNRARFSLSRVKKYDDWVTFCDEASKLWSQYRELVQPTAIKRIGVRFINRMLADYASKDFLTFFKDAPEGKQIYNWDLENFLHRDTLQIPGTDYRVNLTKTIASSPKTPDKVAAILDCDVFYSKNVSCEWDKIAAHLKAMHWIKNKAFFESIAKKKIKEYL